MDKNKAKIEKALKAIWEKAYRAEPHVYEKDGKVVVGFALTENTHSLFPLAPQREWKIGDKTPELWFISVVSLTQDKVIGTIEYHEAIKRLMPDIIAMKDGWGLIRPLTDEKLEALFEGLPRNVI